jgi:hypothetical protein
MTEIEELRRQVADRDKRLAAVIALAKGGTVWFTPDAVIRAAEGRTP